MTAEEQRLEESRQRKKHWKRWGPYLSERAWGTVREDYSSHGTAWEYFPHDHARFRAYRWNEDGLAGVCDRHQYVCFALALWNERDPILKERPFGLTGNEGNHGEDVKEYYYYLESTPTHSYMRYLYKYPQAAFPYGQLVDENRRRGKTEPEFELLDTGVFNDDRYFDVFVEYAKGDVDDLLIQIRAINRGPDPAPIHLLPTIWFRNTWSWDPNAPRPELRRGARGQLVLEGTPLGPRHLYFDGAPDVLVTENETNTRGLWGVGDHLSYAKDGVNEFVVNGRADAVNPAQVGTKAALRYQWLVQPDQTVEVSLRLTDQVLRKDEECTVGADYDAVFAARQREADAFRCCPSADL